MAAKLAIEAVFSTRTGKAIADAMPSALAGRTAIHAITNLLNQGGVDLRAAVAEVAPVAASGSVTCVVASLAAGDTLLLEDVILTCVSGTATAASGQYSKDTSNTACGISLKAAINTYAATKHRWIATESAGTVTVTSLHPGTAGNSTRFRKKVVTAAGHVITAFSGGKDCSSRVTARVTCSQANVDADDTLQIGHVVMTAKAIGQAEGEFTIGASDTAMGDNLAAKINAHSKLLNICTASNASGVVTITFICDPELALG